jgi:LPS-assembly protein
MGLIAEKPITLFNHDFIHSIEPRAKYLFIPKINQQAYPIFDTMPRSFDYLQLFADNRFTGLDRIGDANQLTLGLFSRLNHEDGREFIELGLGQISYFQSRQVQMPSISEEQGDFSDLLVTASVIQGNWRATLTEQLDRDTKLIKQEDRSLQYLDPQSNQFIVRHRLRRQGTATEDEQITLGGQIRYNPIWSSLHFANLNQTSDQMRSAIHAVQYDSCCWGAQLIWEHNLYINDVGSDIIRLAFIFKGLTTFGSLADQKIDSRLYFE